MNENSIFESLKKYTDKQQKWFWAYLKCFNASEAAREAGYEDAQQSGWENKEILQPLIEKYLDLEALSAKEIINLLRQHATFKITDAGKQDTAHLVKRAKLTKFYDANGKLKKEIAVPEGSQFDAVALLAKIHGLTSAKKDDTDDGEFSYWKNELLKAKEAYDREEVISLPDDPTKAD